MAARNLRAVIFDLDGTLLDTLADLADSCNEALRAVGAPLRTSDEVRRFVGNGLSVLMERALPGGRADRRYEEALAALRSAYARNWHHKTRPYDGIHDALGRLSQAGMRLGIVSNKPDAQVKELCALYFDGLIPPQAATGERESAGIRKKPAPDSVLRVIAELGALPEESIYVGDSEVDVQTARNAGIPCVSVCWGFRSRETLQESGATCLIAHPQELVPALLGTPYA